MRVVAASLAVCAFSFLAFAQEDPDPNSPTPILMSENGSTRALAVSSRELGKASLSRVSPRAFALNSKVVFFVTNIDLMKGEGANAFRIYIEDAKGRQYRFPVLSLEPVPGIDGLYSIVVRLKDDIGYWGPPTADGDVLVSLTWRGLVSNRVKLGLGRVGGDIKDDQGAVPTPIGTMAERLKAARNISPDYIGYRWSGDRSRFMEQATFGPESNLDNRIRRIGLKTWLAEQFQAQYPSVGNPYPNQPLKPGTPPANCDNEQTITPDVPVTCFRDTYTMYPIQQWNSYEQLYGSAQLRHRVAWALSEMWVNSGVDIQQSRHMVEYHKILSANAFGNYRNLMKQMTLSPTMGDYLSMAFSTKNSPNENYAREIMQLFTVGLFMLNPDGTQQIDASNNPIPTYDQNVVNNLTKVLTGWTLCNSGCPNSVSGTANYIDPMVLVTGNHDLTAKTLLSYPGSTTTNIAACTGCNTAAITTYANNSMDQALDNIFNHPSLGPYVSKNLIQQMVTSDPTPAYVGRIAAVFNDNGFGVRGDMQAVVKAILLDREARGDVKTDPNFGKLREPVQLATNILREFNVRSASGLLQSDGVIFQRGEYTGMGQIPFRSPTVFNYYSPGYIIPGTSTLGPEFGLMTTGTTIQRANFVNQMVFNNIAAASPDRPNGTSLDLSDLQAISTSDASGNLLMDELNRRMTHGTLSSQMRNTILTAVTNIAASSPLTRAQQAVYLVATSSQYQVQR